MRNYSGSHPSVQSIFTCCRNGDLNSIRRALEAGLDINVLDPKSTDSPLMMACRNGQTDIVRLCLNFGAKNDPHPDFGQTALHAAVSGAHFSAAKVLLETAQAAGAVKDIIDLEDSHGQTPLHAASSIGATDLVQLLLFYEAKISRVDAHAQNTLHLCAGSGNEGCLAMLLDHGGDELLEHQDVNGHTPLHHASFNGHVECVRLLLETAANVLARNYKGQTAFQLAASRDHRPIMALLGEYGGGPPANSEGHFLASRVQLGSPPLQSSYNNVNWSNGTGVPQPPHLQRSVSTPVKQSSHLPLSHQRHASDSELPGPPTAQNQFNLSLPRPHTIASSNVSNRGGQLRFGGSERSEPSTPDSNGYLTARNSEVKSGYRVLTRQGHQDGLLGSPSLSAGDGLGPFGSPGTTGVQVFTKQPIISHSRDMFSSPSATASADQRQQRANAWDANPAPAEVQASPLIRGSVHSRDRLCDSPQQEGSDFSDHLLIGTFSCDSPAKHPAPDTHSFVYRSPSPKKQPVADLEGEGEFADPLEVFDAAGASWHAYETEEGHLYFLDMAAGHSQWEDPRLHGVVAHDATGSDDLSTAVTGGVGCPPNVSPVKQYHLPPKSPSPKALEKGRNFGYSSDDADFGGGRVKAPGKINWCGELSMTDDDAQPTAAQSSATAKSVAALPKGGVVAAKLSFKTDGKGRRHIADDASAFERKVLSIQASSGFSLAADLAKDQAIRNSQPLLGVSKPNDSVEVGDKSAVSDIRSLSVGGDIAREARCQQYLSIVRSGGSLQALREAMEAQAEAQALMLEVFALADELLLDSAPLCSPSPLPTGDSEIAKAAIKETVDQLKSDSTLAKYAKMASMGVPAGNVLAKMKMEGVGLSDRNRLMSALGQPLEVDASLLSDNGSKKASASSFQTLHWNTLPADKLKHSIWSVGPERGPNDLSAALMAETEMEELEKLFSATAAPASSAAATKETAVKETDQLKVLERKRAQNIAIGLVPFRVFGTHMDMLKAICSLDTLGSKITADHLDNFRNLLPTDAEMKRVQDIAGSKHPAELFVQAALMFYPELPRRLNCFITCLNFGGACETWMAKAMKIINCCNQVLSSGRLAKLLQKMLTVGNVMNQGTNRGQAAGFTLDSLLKMVDTKGVDKRTSVLDYVVKSLYDRGEERVLEVIDDLQLVDETAKLSGAETLREFDGIQNNVTVLKNELARNQDTLDSSAFSSPTAKLIVSHFHARLETYLDDFRLHCGKMQRWKDVLGKKMPELLRYFGEDAGSGDVTRIFLVLQKFRNALLFCRESTEWKIYRQSSQDQAAISMC